MRPQDLPEQGQAAGSKEVFQMKYPEEILRERIAKLEEVLRWISEYPYIDPVTRDRKVRAALSRHADQQEEGDA
jgi:hypothetical protein